ncbi:MAG: Asp-tRNA(Asn)/Glu-tRNA(Gln) amidotransferase subunit GatA, partial [Acutalibacteraceae bacterium]|nr:Asp-tRNA(Asn)/Glu-tRNA(Gln) amidotransferase subunit GatA [Acutalibacteraceae bacterium]
MSELTERTIFEHAEALRKKEYSSVQLTQAYLEQIDKKDKTIGAYITVTADRAIESAKAFDEGRCSDSEISPLAGIPCGIKDNMCTKGIKTTCASKMLGGYIPPYSAHVVEKLEKSGAVILGKLNMDEFAMGSTTENSAFKVCRNPLDTDRVPGGSSGGSAAAVAAREAVYTLGSDTGGSIRQPASFCGVVGMKPTYGSVSRYGLVAFASSLDQIGPITSTVLDNALVLNAIVGHDKRDATSVKRVYNDFTADIKNGVKGMKIGVPEEFFGEGISDDVRKAVLAATDTYRALGAELVSVSMPSIDYALSAYYVISSAEASSNLARFDGVRYGYRCDDYSNIDELYRKSRSEGFGSEVKKRIMLGTFALSSGYYDAYYKKALQVRSLVRKDFDEAFGKCDFIISPVTPTVAYKIGEKTGDSL